MEGLNGGKEQVLGLGDTDEGGESGVLVWYLLRWCEDLLGWRLSFVE